MSDLQGRARGLQATVAAVERTAQQQLTTLADHSEVAIDTAQAKLTQMDTQLQEFAKFVKVRYWRDSGCCQDALLALHRLTSVSNHCIIVL